MRAETIELNVVQGATGAGTAVPAAHLVNKYVQTSAIAGGAAVTIEGEIDGTYAAITASITTNTITAVPATVNSIRVNRTVQGTGNPTVTLIGHHTRTE